MKRVSEHSGIPIAGYSESDSLGKALLLGDIARLKDIWIGAELDRPLGERYDARIISLAPLARLLDSALSQWRFKADAVSERAHEEDAIEIDRIGVPGAGHGHDRGGAEIGG